MYQAPCWGAGGWGAGVQQRTRQARSMSCSPDRPLEEADVTCRRPQLGRDNKWRGRGGIRAGCPEGVTCCALKDAMKDSTR